MSAGQLIGKLNKIDASEYGPFTEAVKMENVDTMKVLIARGIDINGRNYCIRRKLCNLAIDKEKLTSAKLLLELSPFNRRLRSEFLDDQLINACSKDRVDLAKLLLELGTNPNGRPSKSQRPIEISVDNKFLKLTELLLEYGANASWTSHGRDSVFQVAAESKQLQMLKLLLDQKLNVWLKHCKPLHERWCLENRDSLTLVLEAGASVHARGRRGLTPLLRACWIGQLNALKLLIKAGADVQAAGDDGQTGLHIAARLANLDLLELLLEAGCDATAGCKDNVTALHLAAAESNFKIIERLLKAGAKVDTTDNSGFTAIYYAAKYPCPGKLELLIKWLAHDLAANRSIAEASCASKQEITRIINLKDKQDGLTALHYAVLSPIEDCKRYISVLLEHGADVNATDSMGTRPVHDITRWPDCLKQYIALGLDIDAMSRLKARSLLHEAVAMSREESVAILVQAQANLNIKDGDGNTALDYAFRNGNDRIINLLLDAGADKTPIFNSST